MARVMVEVEDISMVPKVVNCSYKAISDDAYRTFVVRLRLSSHCLPVSHVTPNNFKLFEEEGEAEVIQGWSSGSTMGMRREIGVADDVRRGELAAAEAEAAGEPEVDAGIDEPARMEGEEPSVQQGPLSRASGAEALLFSNYVHESDMQAGFSERERRRKGKGLLVEVDVGPLLAHTGPPILPLPVGPLDEHVAVGPQVVSYVPRPTSSSGRDSYDPLAVGLKQGSQSPLGSDEAISAAGPVGGPVENTEGTVLEFVQREDAPVRMVAMEEAVRGGVERKEVEGGSRRVVARGGSQRVDDGRSGV